MNRVLTIVFLIALTACSTPTPQVTASPVPTVTLPPASPTPEATATPEPQIAPEIEAAQEFFADKGFEITPDGKLIDQKTGTEIAGLAIVPFDEKTMINRKRPSDPDPKWALQRVYQFEDQENFTVTMTEYDLSVEDGGIDMFGWIYENGEFKRQMVEFAAPNNGTVEIEGFSPEEVQEMIINNSSEDPKYRASNNYQSWRHLALNIPAKVSNRTIYMTYRGMWEPYDNYYYWYGNNFIPAMVSDVTWSTTETTGFVVSPEFKDRSKALVVWMDKNNKPVIVVMEGKWLEMPKYFHKYWETHDIEDPFNP